MKQAKRFLVMAGLLSALLLPAAAAAAQEYPTPTSDPSVASDGGTAVGGAQAERSSASDPGGRGGGTLPVTGGDVIALTLVGAGAVGVGAVLVRSGSRRRAEA